MIFFVKISKCIKAVFSFSFELKFYMNIKPCILKILFLKIFGNIQLIRCLYIYLYIELLYKVLFLLKLSV